jgi:hypothetical protein
MGGKEEVVIEERSEGTDGAGSEVCLDEISDLREAEPQDVIEGGQRDCGAGPWAAIAWTTDPEALLLEAWILCGVI